MQDRSAPKNTTQSPPTTERASQDSRETESPLNSEGPKTNKREERSSIAQLLSQKLQAFVGASEEPSTATKQTLKEKESTTSSDFARDEAAQLKGEPLGFFARLREQGSKFLQIRSMREFISWATETITGLFESAAHSLRFLRIGKPALPSTTLTSPTLKIETPSSTTHGFTVAPTILEPVKEVGNSKARAIDYTAQGITEVAEATRKAAEAKEQKAEKLRAEELHEKRLVRAQILAIDARAGGESPELQAIINQLDGVYGSIEVALRHIMEAQSKELNLSRKKAA